MLNKLMLYCLCLTLWGTAFAESPPPASAKKAMTAAEFEASLKFQQGEVTLSNGIAVLKIPNNFRYLNPKDAERVLTVWGNPSGAKTLGMIFPADVSPVSQESWGVVITYEESGYVSDTDADAINYTDLLKDMQASAVATNEERKKQGYPTVELIGWAAKPYYEKASHKLYWAKELAFEGHPNHTLNYNTRILGRRGVLNLNAVADTKQLASIEKDMQQVLAFTNFNPGYRYEEFDAKTDAVASYGIAALVAGGVAAAAKTGLFGKLLVLLIAFKKIVIIAVIGLGALLFRLFKGKKA